MLTSPLKNSNLELLQAHAGDYRYPQDLEASHNADNRGVHSKFYGNGPAKIKLAEDYPIHEVFITVNHKDTLRGMHFQKPGQPKLIQAVSGAIIGNLLCVDPDLPEFGDVVNFSLAEGDGRILVPSNWALGYRAVSEETTRILYLASADFAPGGDGGVDPFDEKLDLFWGFTEAGQKFRPEDANLSAKDLELPSFAEFADPVGY